MTWVAGCASRWICLCYCVVTSSCPLPMLLRTILKCKRKTSTLTRVQTRISRCCKCNSISMMNAVTRKSNALVCSILTQIPSREWIACVIFSPQSIWWPCCSISLNFNCKAYIVIRDWQLTGVTGFTEFHDVIKHYVLHCSACSVQKWILLLVVSCPHMTIVWSY